MFRFSLFALFSLALLGVALPVMAEEQSQLTGTFEMSHKFGVPGLTARLSFSLVDTTITVTPAGTEEIPALAAQLGSDDKKKSALAFMRLLKAGDSAVPAIIATLPGANNLQAVNAPLLLAAINSKSSLKELHKVDSKPLVSFLRDVKNDNGDRARCAMVIASIGDKDGIAAVKQLLISEVENSKVRASILLGAMVQKNPLFLPEIDTCLRDGDEYIRYTSMIAMTAIEGKKATDHILAMLPDGAQEVRITALQMLSVVEYPLATDMQITSMLFDKESYVRCTSALSLVSEENTRVVPYLLRALKDEDSQVRAAACTSLSNHNKMPEVKAALQLVVDEEPEPSVREAARRALNSGEKEK